LTFTYYKQQDNMDCGPTSLRMVAKYYGRSIPIQKLRSLCFISKGGVNLLAISEAAEKLGMRTTGVKLSLPQLKQAELPCILHCAKTILWCSTK
jgi:ATP-binding cassette, subfamily B, bacterial